MISIVICSTNPYSLDVLKKNINETIGTPYELNVIDNSANNHSIFSAYNKGQESSQFPYLCFVHEDIRFATQDWGKALTSHLSDASCGIVGVCGGFALPCVPATWSFSYFTEYILQSDKNHAKPILKDTAGESNENYKRVVALDGVFLGVRKDLFEKIRFDESHFNGFHFYDVDICLQAHFEGFENRAVHDILLEHFSKGSQNRQWVENSLIFLNKWEKLLPVSVIKIPDSDFRQKEYHYMTGIYMKRMIRTGYATKEILRIMTTYLKPVDGESERSFRLKMMRLIFLTRLRKRPSSLFR